MFIAALKCDFCGNAHEIPCRKAGDTPKVPDAWATVTPMIRIVGTPTGVVTDSMFHEGKEFIKVGKKPNGEDAYDWVGAPKTKYEKKKEFEKRKKSLRAKFDKSHICPDCVEEINTGKRSIKIEAPKI